MLIGCSGHIYKLVLQNVYCRIVLSVPGQPQDVKVSAINSTSLHVTWKPPPEKEKNGIIRGYHVHVQEIRDEVKFTNIHFNFALGMYLIFINEI